MARVVFLGTPAAAQPTLEAVASRHDVALVVTQPDRPKGRSGKPVAPPVKETAREMGLEVAQPTNRAELLSAIERRGPLDVGVVVAFGQILRPEVLALPTHGYLNVHFSLLPRWRGAAPVARALMSGDEMTGVTIMKLDEGLDTGPVITAQAIDVEPSENAGHLTERLAGIGASLLAGSLNRYLSGELAPVPQSDDGLTYADKISAHDRPLGNLSDPIDFVNRVRGLAPAPGATLLLDGERFQILAAELADVTPPTTGWGSVDGWPVVRVGGGAVHLRTVQPPGKKPMSGDAWLRGSRRTSGSVS